MPEGDAALKALGAGAVMRRLVGWVGASGACEQPLAELPSDRLSAPPLPPSPPPSAQAVLPAVLNDDPATEAVENCACARSGGARTHCQRARSPAPSPLPLARSLAPAGRAVCEMAALDEDDAIFGARAALSPFAGVGPGFDDEAPDDVAGRAGSANRSSGAVALDLRFGRTLALLSIYIADTGLRTESERLHRRRPVKTTDRTYIALEAFQVEPSETVRLSLAPLGAPLKLPRAALYAVVALAAGLVVSFVAAPLRAARWASAADDAMEIQDAALHEREAVYASLRDLEHDHETAKLSDEDYQSMRGDLRSRAAALLRASTGEAGARSEPQAS